MSSWQTPEKISIEPLYSAADLEDVDHLESMPGFPPFLRGPYATMYVMRPWTVRQYAGFSTAKDSNDFYRRNLAAGQRGLSIAFDLATHRGYDSDHPRVAGDVGMAGVAIDSIYGHAHAVRGHSFGSDERLDDDERRRAADHGALHRGGGRAGREARATRRHDSERHSQRVHGPQHLHLSAPNRASGSSPTSSSTPASGCPSSTASASAATTCKRPERRPTWSWPTRWPTDWSTCAPASKPGLEVDAFCPRLSFFWGIGMNYFMEVAKLRAARMIWAKLIKQFQPEESQESFAADPLPDQRLEPHRAGRL